MIPVLKPVLVLVCCVAAVLAQRDMALSRTTSFLRSDYWTASHEKSPGGILAVVTGFRSFAADMYWFDLIQYYGDSQMSREGYRKFYPKLRTVTAMDPHFIHAYTFGGAVLAWNMNRIPEAVALMTEGVRNNPGTKEAGRLSLYMAALTYQQDQDTENLVPLLEEIVREPFHPPFLERMLGLIYERHGQWKKAQRYWVWVAENTKDGGVRETALQHLRKIKASGR
jgi:tetratricopeptide (TPR) repeat protein